MWTYHHIDVDRVPVGEEVSVVTVASPEELGAAVRAARVGLNWTQADLAQRAGLSREWVSRMEAGTHRLEFDKVMTVMGLLGFGIVAPVSASGGGVGVRRRVSAKARERALAEIEVGQRLAGHHPSPDALQRAAQVLDGELDPAQARAELVARHRKGGVEPSVG